MPAFRSRTLHWRRVLGQLASRGGSIEVAFSPASDVPATSGSAVAADFVWRLKIVQLDEAWIEVEAPEVLHRTVPVAVGTRVVAAIVVGPNRWMFRSECLAGTPWRIGSMRQGGTIRIRMPEEVARTRRAHLRVETASIELPTVRAWALLEPGSVRPVQRSLALAAEQIAQGQPLAGAPWHDETVRPTLGPEFAATLVNIGGGGAGLRLSPSDASVLGPSRLLWLHVDLRPDSSLPLCVAARVAHLHLEASGATYAGVAFDFTADSSHAQLVARQVLGVIARRQGRGAEPMRRAA